MVAPRTLIAALGLGTALGVSCYSEQLPPPTYRFACDADTECLDGEICRSGQCERPCTQSEVLVAFALKSEVQPCPVESGYAGCFNGACVNTCELDGDFCSPGQACADVGLEISGGGFGGSSTATVGVCVNECTGNDDRCLDSETCIDGVCTAIDCAGGEACPEGNVCVFGTCLPDCSAGQACASGESCNPLLGPLRSVCTSDCDPACDEGDTCFFGACGTACTPEGDECDDDDDLSCLLGVCLSNEFELPGGGGDGGNPGDGTSGDGGESTGMGAQEEEEELR